jgi:drug/metabolite transporter (DMT)-like permease
MTTLVCGDEYEAPESEIRMTRLRADALLLVAAAIWGVAFVFQKSAMLHIGPLTMVGARSTVAVAALLPLALWMLRGEPPGAWQRALGIGVKGGVLFFLGAAFQQFGLVTTTVTNTGFITGLYVILTPFLLWAVRREPPSMFVAAAALISFLGTWLLGGGSLAGFTQGDVLVAICAIFWAAHVIVTADAARAGPAAVFTTIQFATVAVLGWIGAFAFETVTLDGLWNGAKELAYVGLLSSAVTFLLLTIALKHTTAPEAAILVSTETVFAATAAYFLSGERLSWIGLAGAALMLAATVLVQLGPLMARRSMAPAS